MPDNHLLYSYFLQQFISDQCSVVPDQISLIKGHRNLLVFGKVSSDASPILQQLLTQDCGYNRSLHPDNSNTT